MKTLEIIALVLAIIVLLPFAYAAVTLFIELFKDKIGGDKE